MDLGEKQAKVVLQRSVYKKDRQACVIVTGHESIWEGLSESSRDVERCLNKQGRRDVGGKFTRARRKFRQSAPVAESKTPS